MRTRFALAFGLILSCLFLSGDGIGLAHEGPDPIAHWKFDSYHVEGKTLKAKLGPNGTFTRNVSLVKDEIGQSVFFKGRGVECVIAENGMALEDGVLPVECITVSAWVAIEKPQAYGGIACLMQDNGSSESGWVLGYQNRNFCFGLASEGANDGDGLLTYLLADQEFELGKFYFVVGVYDCKAMEIYVNGKLAGRSEQQSGKIFYPKKAPFVLGSYHDENEFNPMQGRLREIAIYDLAAKAAWVEKEFEHQNRVAKLESRLSQSGENFVVRPYLQYGTMTSMTVAWRATKACKGQVYWGEDDRCINSVDATQSREINHVVIENLKPETQYFYYVQTSGPDGEMIQSDVSTFQTACRPETPFAFAVVGDTQSDPKVSGPIAKFAWQQRPHFLLHAGDLVDQGKMNDDWIDEFFASMHPLISRVPFYPVLGNHEQNAKNYFDYMALPAPEYYYRFRYGNAEFFMIDSNRNIGPDSEQYKWLDKALGESKANWKFVCHHHPVFSSDENDYGNLWKTNKSTRGDVRAKQLITLYDKHEVDIVWNGHIHSYERTWPVRNNKAVPNGKGTMYMITGGGGGPLETPGPYRPFFQHTVKYGHHYTMVMVNGNELQLKAYDFENRLFDTVQVFKHQSKK